MNNIAIIVGGSKGMGNAAAQKLTDKVSEIWLVARNQKELDAENWT